MLLVLGGAPGLKVFGRCLESGMDKKQCFLIILIKEFGQLLFISCAGSESEPYLSGNISSKEVLFSVLGTIGKCCYFLCLHSRFCGLGS